MGAHKRKKRAILLYLPGKSKPNKDTVPTRPPLGKTCTKTAGLGRHPSKGGRPVEKRIIIEGQGFGEVEKGNKTAAESRSKQRKLGKNETGERDKHVGLSCREKEKRF